MNPLNRELGFKTNLPKEKVLGILKGLEEKKKEIAPQINAMILKIEELKKEEQGSYKGLFPEIDLKAEPEEIFAVRTESMSATDLAFYFSGRKDQIGRKYTEIEICRILSENQKEEAKFKIVQSRAGKRSQPEEEVLCDSNCTDDEKMIYCDGCRKWFHIPCLNMNEETFQKLSETPQMQWFCPNCEDITQPIPKCLKCLKKPFPITEQKRLKLGKNEWVKITI